jgi:hypothetical protein
MTFDLRDLRKLNFEKLIAVDVLDVGAYTFSEYKARGYEHSPINGYCVSCEEKGYNTAADDKTYKLTNISHGAHSSDFFLSLKETLDCSGWHQEPVVFIYETPSLDYKIFKGIEYMGQRKNPSKDWYWIHTDQESVSYPEHFRGGEYGGFVLSAILTFQLANTYMTNLVKCGLNNPDGKLKGLSSYKDECIKNCYERFLFEELNILKPSVIFAVGSAVDKWVRNLVKDSFFVQQLPHPAGRRRGFRDEHYKVLYFWLVVRALHKVGIVQLDEGKEMAELFLRNYEAINA